MNSDEGRHSMKTKRLKVLLPVLLLAVLLVVTIVFIVQRGEKNRPSFDKEDSGITRIPQNRRTNDQIYRNC